MEKDKHISIYVVFDIKIHHIRQYITCDVYYPLKTNLANILLGVKIGNFVG